MAAVTYILFLLLQQLGYIFLFIILPTFLLTVQLLSYQNDFNYIRLGETQTNAQLGCRQLPFTPHFLTLTHSEYINSFWLCIYLTFG